ncbi:MAG TPA: hypothetical protein VGH32_00985 [Pirellulales bacterium]|jgi:predicted NUDIX family NTP pyrophosphohydrolase
MPKRVKERARVRAVCPIAYRRRESQIEYCLMLIAGDSRWEFPHGELAEGEPLADAATRIARQSLGIRCRVDDEPLAEFQILRDGASYQVTAMLTECVKEVTAAATQVRRWFLHDEASVRIRRKPMRRCAFLAKRRIDANGA